MSDGALHRTAVIGALALCWVLGSTMSVAAPLREPEPSVPPSPAPARDPGAADTARAIPPRLVVATPLQTTAVSQSVAITVQVIPGGPPPTYTTWLGRAGPNPFRTSTIIRYSCATAGNVSIRVYSVQGQTVATLVDRYHQAGQYTLWWDAQDGSGRRVAPGVYFYQMAAGRKRINSKLVYLP